MSLVSLVRKLFRRLSLATVPAYDEEKHASNLDAMLAESKLIFLAESVDYNLAKGAIRDLSKLPLSEEIFRCLDRHTREGHHKSSAIATLAAIDHPQADERVVEIISSRRLYGSDDADILGRLRSRSAVGPLLMIALRSSMYYCIEEAIDALYSIKTPEAAAALREFYDHPAREIFYWYQNADDYESISSSWLGQTPTQEERLDERRRQVCKNPFAYGTHDELEVALGRICSHPDREQIRKLTEFLDETRVYRVRRPQDDLLARRHAEIEEHHLGGEGSYNVFPFLAPWLEECFEKVAARRGQIYNLLSARDTAKLESCLFEHLSDLLDWRDAFQLLNFLPQIRNIAELEKLATCEKSEDRIRLLLFRLMHKHAPERLLPVLISHVTAQPGSSISPDVVKLLVGYGQKAVSVFESLLHDERWAARKRAVEFFGQIGDETGRRTLGTRLLIERDEEIRCAIEDSLKAQDA